MTYYPNIPQSTDNPSNSQPQIIANFGSLNSVYGTDHIPFTSSSSIGQHNQTNMPDRTSSLPTFPGAGNILAYAKTTNGITQQYYLRDGIPTIYPVSAIKAMASFNSLNGLVNGNTSIQQSFNITGPITQTHPSGLQQFNVTLTNACQGTNYLIMATGNCQNTFGLFLTYNIISSNSFTISSICSEGALTYPTNYLFIVLDF
jgi:hypothetical protein